MLSDAGLTDTDKRVAVGLVTVIGTAELSFVFPFSVALT
jgi:hypothetical protein